MLCKAFVVCDGPFKMTNSSIIKVFASRLSRGIDEVLDRGERAEAAAIADPERRVRHVRIRSFVRQTLAKCLDCDPLHLEFRRTSAGKPFIEAAPRCEFSLSHSGDWVALAVAPFEVGVDIEARVPRIDPRLLAARFFSLEDAAVIERAGGNFEREFLAQWVAKEAALKAAGTGIAGYLEKLRCDFAKGTVVAIGGLDGGFAIHPFQLPDGTPGAVAWSADRGETKVCLTGIVLEE